MAASKPMTLLCLEAVLQNMEPNLRFRLAQHCPAISSIEKQLPLHIKSLKLSEYEFTVNDTNYRLGVYQDYPDGLRIPDAVKELNDEGGEQLDLDKYGIKTYSQPAELTPGDIEINNANPLRKPLFTPRIRRMERRLGEYESALARRNRSRPSSPETNYSPGSSPDYRNRSPRPGSRSYSPCSPGGSRRASPVYTSSPNYSPCEAETDLDRCTDMTLQEKVHSKNAELLPFLMRRDGEEPSWSLFAQLTISKDESKVIYRGRYTTLAQNMKSLYTFFFGSRKSPIKIDKLSIDCIHYDAVLRLPENLKFKVSSLKLKKKSQNICEALTPIICESSFPLQHVEVVNLGDHPWIRTARSLKVIVDYPTLATTQYILSLECEKLKLKDRYSTFTVIDCIPLIEQWLKTGKTAGTCYEFSVPTTDLDILKGIANRFNGEYKDRAARIPMNEFGLELHLDYITGDKITFKMEVKQNYL
ncbi:unnamed protein product [Caenorhabditis brenneri]